MKIDDKNKSKKSAGVDSIVKALNVLKKKTKSKNKGYRQQRAAKVVLNERNVSGFPVIEGLNEEKSIIGRGMVALNKALYEQTLYESERLGKIRNILSKIEIGLFDEETFKKLDPAQQLKIFEVLRKDSEATVNFLERMQRNSLQVMLVFEIYKKLMDTIEDDSDMVVKGLPSDLDRGKVMQVRGALIEMLNK